MRKSLVIVAACLSASSLSAVPPHRAATKAPIPAARLLPTFSFLGATTATPTAPFKLGANDCTPASSGKTECSNGYDASSEVKIGNAGVATLIMNFNDGRLSGLIGETSSYDFSKLEDAFTAKYGPPAAHETRKWESKAGGVFDNGVLIWHFKGGDLELEEMGSERDNCQFSFADVTNQPASAPTPVNF